MEQAEPELTRVSQAAWLRRLAAEHVNLWAALEWARYTGETDQALTMAGRMWRFWQFRGHFAEARNLAGQLGEWWLEFEALLGLVATIACHRGDPHEAAPLEQQARPSSPNTPSPA